jgi:hypothetical protein
MRGTPFSMAQMWVWYISAHDVYSLNTHMKYHTKFMSHHC